ncbi:MAG: Serine phosphatase RsbU, regulator of sigma subunit [Candidatus Rifleibacterium amylolyticum]|nr:MAG: Serine phosphatase RsbU, regulator of sigma subunit [Candidatus Rifleibacterium amylolyticum]
MNMKPENNSLTSRTGRLLRWLLAALCLTGVPAALVFFAVHRFYTVSEDELKLAVKAQLQRAANEAAETVDQEVFWSRLFFEQFSTFEREKTQADSILAWLKSVQSQFPGSFEFIAWSRDGRELAKTFTDRYSTDDWRHVFWYFSALPGFQVGYERHEHDVARVRDILGPQLIHAMMAGQNDPERYSLAWLDSSFERPPITRYFISTIAVVIRYDLEKLRQMTGLTHTLQKFADSSRLHLGIVSVEQQRPQILWKSGEIKGELLDFQTFAKCENESRNFLELPQHYLGYIFLAPGKRIFALAAKKYDSPAIFWRSLLAAACYLTLMLPFLVYTWNTMVAGRPGRARIKTRLAFLFFFACGIPLLAMIVVSHEHNLQMRRTMIAEAHQSATDMILSFDRRFLSFLDNDAVSLDRLLDQWADGIKKSGGVNDKIAIQINQLLASFTVSNYYVVASDSKQVIDRGEVFVLKGNLDSASIDREKSKIKREITTVVESDIITANLVGKKVMSDLNRVEISGPILSKLEIIAESLLQQTMLEMTNTVIGNLGSINHWGFGRLNDLSLMKLLSVNRPGIVDYAVMIFWRPIFSQTRFINKAVPLVNRNPHGYRLIVRNRFSDSYLPEIDNQAADLRKFASRLGARPTEEIEQISFAGEDYIAVGFNGSNVRLFQVMALYPLRNIDRVIDQQQTQLLLFVLFCIILAASLAQILAKSFIEPLHALRSGALAIENREFSHRIRGVGKDEFGEIAGIFNEIMVGFSELEVARIVQDSLFPPPGFAHGNFVTFGKSISMSELGGDYFDFFAIDEQNFAVLAGDVAGHGVGAALIMAMAKAGILSSTHLLDRPAELMMALHRMIMASKGSNQKRIMTFQYLYLDSQSGRGLYSNAGGCSPVMIRATDRSVNEVTLTGPALGAFTRAKYNECPVEFGDGDAIVFYTDGIIEARSPAGGEIGYDGFKKILQASYDTDPQIFYQNIYSAYISHIGGTDAQDDLTLIVTIRHSAESPV